MIFIAGVSPKTTVLDQTARLCPVCGLARARMQRVDHWLNLFFIPVFRVKKGDAFLFCGRCDRSVNDNSGGGTIDQAYQIDTCSACRHSLEKNHRFCPYCGHPRRQASR